MRDGLFHHTRRFDHLRQKHFALTEQIANDIHAIHQRTFNDVNRTTATIRHLLTCLFRIFNNPLCNAVNKRM